MFPAFLTAFLFASSGVLARKSLLLLGSQRANLARQLVALMLLGLWAHVAGQGFHDSPSLRLFLISGIVGFGIGDWALFEALPRIGSALTILLCQCLAAPVAALTEWVFLGTKISALQFTGSALILAGVAVAVMPVSGAAIPSGHRLAGVVFGVVAAIGQAWGAVLSRAAYRHATAEDIVPDGLTAAYQRLWGGVLALIVFILIRSLFVRRREASPAPDWKRGSPWMLANALAGPTLGVGCYQWALRSTPSAVVLPVVALAPLIVMGMSWTFEGIRPTPREVLGAVVAVLGVVLLTWH